jgi:hypothetical protein
MALQLRWMLRATDEAVSMTVCKFPGERAPSLDVRQ